MNPSEIKRSKKLSAFWVGSFFIFLFVHPSSARAWYDHTALTPWIVRTFEARVLKDPKHPYTVLHAAGPRKVDPSTTRREFQNLSQILLMNPQGKLKSAEASSVTELLTLSPEDPDHGMDQNLPGSADPQNERKYMGGHQHTGSQGFRHMYFGGINWRHPLATFQIPFHGIGQAIDRFVLLSNEGRNRIVQGDLWWGLRIVGWAMHYLQDLTQPFHTNQIPSLHMLYLKSLIHWPPAEAWNQLRTETTRTIENYHWAYEGYVRDGLLMNQQSPFHDCLSQEPQTLVMSSPRELAEEIIAQSRRRSPGMGSSLMDLAGHHLKNPEFHLSRQKGSVNSEEMRTSPEGARPRRLLNENTCESLALARAGSLWLLEWAFRR